MADDELKHVRILDPRVDVGNSRNKTYGILSGGGQQTFKQYVSQSFDNSQISWQCDPPNERTFVNRKVYMKMKFRLTFTGTSGGAGVTLIQALGMDHAAGVSPGTSYRDAPRCCPLSQAFKTIQCTLNNDSIATNLAAYSRIYQRYARDGDEQNLDLSMTPAMPDQSQSYASLQGYPRNPLAGYGNNTEQTPRGGFTNAKIIRNDSTGAPGDICIVELECVEPIWLSPFANGRGQEEVAFIQLQNINILCTLGGRGVGVLGGLASSLWSHSPDSASVFSDIQADVLSGEVQFNYITPDISESIPRNITYSYFEPSLYPTTSFAPIAPGDQGTFQMNTVSLKSIPNRMYIWVGKRDQDCTMESTDTFFRLDSINVTFGNRDGLLSNASTSDLYQMHLRNGGNSSFEQWHKQVGSVLCVSFGTDIPLEALQAPGLRENQTISMMVKATNLSDVAQIPTLNVLVVQEGVMSISSQSVTRSVGLLSREDIMYSKDGPTMPFRKSKNFYGSGFWDTAGDFFKRIVRPVIDVAKTIVPPQWQPAVGIADEVAKSYGLGLGRMRGGAMLTKQQLTSLK